jgi:hypothetical protein
MEAGIHRSGVGTETPMLLATARGGQESGGCGHLPTTTPVGVGTLPTRMHLALRRHCTQSMRLDPALSQN